MALYTKLHKTLLEAGLTETEAIVYIELLKKPAQNKWELVTRTGLNRNSVYRAFIKLESLKLVKVGTHGIQADSLKSLVGNLNTSIRKNKKLANKIKNIAPYLHMPKDSIDSIETFYTRDQIVQAYLFMADHEYEYNLEFGDFENFVPVMGSMNPPIKFRNQRVKYARARAICTTYGPYSAYFANKELQEKFKVDIDHLKINFDGSFIQFSDNNDFVLFNNFSDPENHHSILIKSKTVADVQRRQFACFSQMIEN